MHASGGEQSRAAPITLSQALLLTCCKTLEPHFLTGKTGNGGQWLVMWRVSVQINWSYARASAKYWMDIKYAHPVPNKKPSEAGPEQVVAYMEGGAF